MFSLPDDPFNSNNRKVERIVKKLAKEKVCQCKQLKKTPKHRVVQRLHAAEEVICIESQLTIVICRKRKGE